MSDSCWPFPPPPSSSSPRMHHSALPPAFIASPPLPHHHHHHHQSTTPFMTHSGHSHVQQQQQQQHFPGQNLDTALENNDWSPAQFPSMLSGYTCPEQDMGLHLSSQNQFDSGVNYDSFQSEVFHYPDPQCLQSNVYAQSSSTITSSSDENLSHWGPLEPTTPQLQCSSLGFPSRDPSLGSWNSTDYSFTSNTDNFFQFYPNSYQENQSFLSPATPGPSPHYPAFVTSPSTENGSESLAFQTYVDPGGFTVTSEIKNSQTEAVQEQTKQKRATRGRGGGAGRPRKNRADKNKDKDSPVPGPVLDAAVAAVMPPSLPERPEEEAGLGDVCGRSQYHSLMRSRADGDRRSHYYRPNPLLCPVRAGSGLFCSVTSRGGKKSGSVPVETSSGGTLTSGTIAPCINVGQSFQAEIPPLKDQRHTHADSHNALLLWRPLKELEQSVNQQRVEALLKLARSSAVPGGGANPDDVLLLLSENRGDFLLTVEKLLALPKSTKKKQALGRHSPALSDIN